ncbi:gustatory receptor 189 [Tribolium castaneum]|uniref:Gustatory receptor n=1 Tax=Tribolium castaneum TaxID=7070 RepID=D6WTL3_TRICA|nr:PREDICTED: uncharacterized protein LOC107398364 [Tribolium castaneum]EFA07636.1 gustatory receptor 189 [Tribolium castaneum]|eukprot:XP_015837717.1 PREDICTED: uncharacterized protein LOC107398364 [Tribolium castaneum]
MTRLVKSPIVLIYIYRVFGIIQFCDSRSEIAKFVSRHVCILFYLFYIYISVQCYQSFKTIIFTGIFFYFDFAIMCTSYVLMFTLISNFYFRNDQLEKVLFKLKSICPKSESFGSNFIRLMVTVSAFFFIFLLFLVEDMPLVCSMELFLPLVVASFNHVFLYDVMAAIFSKFQTINNHINSISVAEIENLIILHSELTDMATHFFYFFEIPTIVGLVNWFGYALNMIYYILYVLINSISLNMWFFAIFNISILSFLFFWLFSIIWALEQTRKKAKETLSLIHDAWNEKILKRNIDSEARHLILLSVRLFVSQLKFSARNYFNVDWSFFHLALSAIATYVIILVQFNFKP